MQYIDAHTHLNSDELYPTRQVHLSDFIALWWIGLVNVWVDQTWNLRWIEIAEKAKELYGEICVVKATVWGHPSEVAYGHIYDQGSIDSCVDALEKLLQKHASCIVAVGECGIDAHYPWFTDQIALLQQDFFRKQCLLARAYNLPVVIHSRDAFALTYTVLEEFTDLHIYFHCWWYGPEEAKKLIETFPHLRFGFCGNSTYPKAEQLRATFLFLITHPAYLQGSIGILLETDAPWLAPQSKRGQRHTPAYILEQYAFLAWLANQSVADFSERVIVDRKRCYHL